MQIVKKELEILKKEIEKSFTDPIPNNTLNNFVLSGSKFIRSTLTILYLKAQGVEINPNIYNILCAGELVHSASLLHDDVIDGAKTRRGQSTIAEIYSPKISILSGDFLLSIAIEKLLDLKNFEIIDIFKTCTKQISEAEVKQYFLRNKMPSEQEYIDICRNKTANLFSAILKSTSIINNQPFENAENFGENFGLAFQIKNDLETESAKIDKKNGIYTAEKVLGIEKTLYLLDNYKKKMENLIEDFPKNIYKESLKELIKSL